jgi:hypothetical protein
VPDRRLGRAEAAVNAELVERHDIRAAERAALRVMAHGVDIAEASADPDVIARANDVYLKLRQAAGLSSGGAKPADAFDEILRALASPTVASDVPDH